MRGFVASILLAAALGALGCDNRPTVVPTPDKPAEATKTGPTTQELVDGPRTPMALKVMPISVRVPTGWKLDTSAAPLVSLQGPAPSGDVEINISTSGAIDAKRIQATIAGGKASAAKDPAHLQVTDLREINGLKIYERIETPVATTQPSVIVDDTGTHIVPQFISWTFVIYTPHGTDLFLPCSFSFIGLSTEQFAADQAFLRSVLESATYDESAELQ